MIIALWSDFQRNQSEILIIPPPKFLKFNLKKLYLYKLIAKNIASAGSQTQISCIPYECPKLLDYRDLCNIPRNNR